jgi:hypothetical protein
MEPDRMTEDEATELMARLAASDQASIDARSLPSTQDVAALLGTDDARVRRELEILRHERRIAELERQRKAEEELLNRMRSESGVAVEQSEDVRRDEWRRRQERMELWSMRDAENLQDEVQVRKPSLAKPILIILAILLFLFVIAVLVPSTQPQTPAPPMTQ